MGKKAKEVVVTDAEKAKAYDEIQSKKDLQKKKDRFYWERTKWEIQEMKRVILEKGLEEELQPFHKKLEDYI
jgi:hypothetical protein